LVSGAPKLLRCHNQCDTITIFPFPLFSDKDEIAIELGVSQFRPEELSVNLRDRELIIEGHHEERSDDYGSIERHFVRQCSLSENTKLDTIESHLSDKGVLSISAKKIAPDGAPAKSIPIQSVQKQQKPMKNNDEKPQAKL
uniref:SHSP domain-containing protein n=1 Tax=Parascaris equorum TaxID=6256 RepID=A0A914R9N8_PAREQ